VLPMCPVRSVTYVSGRSNNEPDVKLPSGGCDLQKLAGAHSAM
jgi:hypothetical protein